MYSIFLFKWQLWTGLRSRRISSNSDSDSGRKILTPTPSPTPLWLRRNKSYSILKNNMISHFLDFHFDYIQKGDTQYSTRSRQLRMQPAVAIADSFEYWSVWQVPLSYNDRDGPKIILITFFRRSSINKWHFNFIYTLFLFLFFCLWMFSGECITVRQKSSSAAGC